MNLNPIDYIIIINDFVYVVFIGIFLSNKAKNLNQYFLGDNQIKWYA